MSAYYNEFDPHMAAWLRELIADKLIAPGDVDERSITDVQPSDLDGYTQCHFFAGVGVWSRALRSAGWSDDRPIWTGSCPCQPFSAAGNQKGDSDERHLWPAFFDLIRARNPGVVVGEQVASWQVVGRAGGKSKETDGPAWIDAVQADLAGANYASGFAVFPSAGIGSPHIRLRAWWMGYSIGEGLQGHGGSGEIEVSERRERAQRCHSPSGDAGRLADSTGERHDRRWASEASNKQGEIKRPERLCDAGRLEDADSQRLKEQRLQLQPGQSRQSVPEVAGGGEDSRLGHTNSEWRAGELPEKKREAGCQGCEDGHDDNGHPDAGEAGRLADSNGRECSGRAETTRGYKRNGQDTGRTEGDSRATGSRSNDRLADSTSRSGCNEREQRCREHGFEQGNSGSELGRDSKVRAVEIPDSSDRPGPTNGFWRDADWLGCRDGKWRPVEPGLKSLVNGTSQRVVRLRDKSTPENGGRSEGKRALTDQEAEDARDTSEARVMRLKGYGNAINAEAGRVFIESVMELMP